jgi:fumarate reductase subunit C
MKKRTYFIFVLRELSSVFVGWFAVFLMVMLFAIGRGPEAYQNFLNWAASPVVVIVNVVALAFLILHTVTWFVLTSQAMEVRLGGRQVPRVKMVTVAGRSVPAATVVRVGGRRVPSGMVIASQYAALIVVSAFIVWLVLR